MKAPTVGLRRIQRRTGQMTTLETRSHDATTERRKLTAGWHNDPKGHHRLRYFDGDEWTDHVTHFGPTPCLRCADPS